MLSFFTDGGYYSLVVDNAGWAFNQHTSEAEAPKNLFMMIFLSSLF
jgi:hypothetical protein